MSVTLKLATLAVRTLAKPLSNRLKKTAREHPKWRRLFVTFSQGLHRIDMRMRLGLLQDQEVIDRQIKKEAEAAEARRRKAEAPTVMTKSEMKEHDRMTEQEKTKIKESHKPRIRPLSESKAIEAGANFVSEAFIFGVGVALIMFESWRSSRKEKGRRNEVAERLDTLQTEVDKIPALEAEILRLRAENEEAQKTTTATLSERLGLRTPAKKPTLTTETSHNKPDSPESSCDKIDLPPATASNRAD
ncbi:MAG: hypothetical protein M1820_002946 [Bogoriella megaspora]|nr:MAG: hypothetical protein M1820_002946 [Bogoriella megaspora]